MKYIKTIMDIIQKMLAIFLIGISLAFILWGVFGQEENGNKVSALLLISGVLIFYLSSKTLAFNKKSIDKIKSRLRRIELTIKFGEDGKKMALKEVFEKKDSMELLERYELDYNKVRYDVKLIMIEELKKRDLITEEEYNVKLKKINEGIEDELTKAKEKEEEIREKQEKNKIQNLSNERLVNEYEKQLNKKYNYDTKLAIVEEIKKRKLIDEKKIEEKIDWINKKEEEHSMREKYISGIIIGIFIGVIPLMSFFKGIEDSDPYLGFSIIIYPFLAIVGCIIALIVITSITKNSAILGSALITFFVSILLYQGHLNISNQMDKKKSMALSIAAKEKDYKKCEKLLRKYKNTYNDPDNQGYNSLHYALVNRDENLIKLLVENKIYLKTKDSLNNYDFFNFSQNTKDIILNDLEILSGGSPNKIIFIEISKAKENQKELIEKFYENGMSINIPSGHGNMDLIDYVLYSEVSDEEKTVSLNYLIEKGIDINRTNSYDKENIMFDLARSRISFGNDKLLKYAEYFVGKGLNVNTVNNSKENLLHIAFKTRNFEFIDFLIKNKGNLEQKNERKQIPLLKIFNGDKIILQDIKSYLDFYYKNNANPFIPDEDDENLINYIEKYNKENKNAKEKSEIEDFKNELIEIMKNRNGD